MEHETFTAGAYTAKVYRCNTAVVGSGAAGFNAADRLWQLGQHDIVLVTENRAGGTSRNTGSDKQTYYKLTLSGGEPDSVREMADTLYAGRCVDGDLALCEAALSSWACRFPATATASISATRPTTTPAAAPPAWDPTPASR